MDVLISSIQSSSSQPGQLKELHNQLKQNWNQLVELSRNQQTHQVVAVGLDPAIHTLGIIHILAAKAFVLGEDDIETFFQKTRLLLLHGDASQIQIASKLFVDVTRKFTECATLRGVSKMGVHPLKIAAAKLLQDIPAKTPSPIDADFLQLCLLAGFYPQAGKHIDSLSPILSVDPKNTHLEALDLLRFWYQAGMVRLGLKQYDASLRCFISCISTPAKDISSVAVEAYKKAIMVSLIVNGEKPTLPSYTSSFVSRLLKNNKDVYYNIAECYKDDKLTELVALLNQEADQLNMDRNMGLAKQVMDVLVKRRVARLSRCYKTLSLEDMTSKTFLDSIQQTEKILIDLIGRNELNASVDQQASLVYFGDEVVSSKASAAEVSAAIQQIVSLSKRVEQLDIMFAKHPKFLKSGRGAHDDDDFAAMLAETERMEDQYD